jgi:hypothetical protein
LAGSASLLHTKGSPQRSTNPAWFRLARGRPRRNPCSGSQNHRAETGASSTHRNSIGE